MWQFQPSFSLCGRHKCSVRAFDPRVTCASLLTPYTPAWVRSFKLTHGGGRFRDFSYFLQACSNSNRIYMYYNDRVLQKNSLPYSRKRNSFSSYSFLLSRDFPYLFWVRSTMYLIGIILTLYWSFLSVV